MKKYIKEIVFLFIVITISLNVISYYKALDLNKEKLFFNSLTLINGENFTLKKDKPLLIYFWATWCPICKIESPNIQRLSKEYEVLTIAVNSGTNQNIKAYIEKNNYTFKVYNDTNEILNRKLNIKAYPTTLIYDKNKNLFFSDVGYTSTIGLKLRMFLASF